MVAAVHIFTESYLFAATFLMECTTIPGKNNKSVVTGLCWANDKTLIGVQMDGFQILKFTVNTDTKACVTEVLEETVYNPYDVTCSKDEVFVSHYSGLRVYNVTSGKLESWGHPDVDGITYVAANDDLVVLGALGGNKVYSRETRTHLYTFDHGGKEKPVNSNYLTVDNLYWVCTYSSQPELRLIDLKNNGTSIGKDELLEPNDISGIPGRYVFVSDWSGSKVVMYTEDGTYLNDLQIDQSTEDYLGANAALERPGRDNLIAFGIQYSKKNPVKIYTLQP